ncbi:GAF domain-containing protein [Cryobacterium sp. Y57]|uniref:GAF domain-containing protein n=1 Tax=Cryobacterium sp. Y57 TaxID=2048287 RepID=UPI001304E595|nr:GAF domain-containing protein [Cryobacterium sp. Y57]
MEYVAWIPSALGGIAAVGAAVCWAFVGTGDAYNGTLFWWGMGLSAWTVLTNIMLEVWRHQSRKSERGEASRTRSLLTDALVPIIVDMARMPSKTRRVREIALVRIVSNACASINVALPEGENLRVIVYRIEEKQPDVMQLVSMNHIGRSDKPGKLIDVPSHRGAAIFQMIRLGKSLFVGDIAVSDEPGVERKGKRYGTFISSPIIADGKAYGMLSVDSPSVGSLDENDIVIVDVFAGLLAIAFAEAEKQ